MVQLVLTSDFKFQVLQGENATVHMKEPRGLLGKFDLNKREMCEVVMQTAEPYSVREATDRFVKILDSTYAKAYLNHIANNTTQLNAEERTQLLRLLEYFKDFFYGTLGEWATEPVNLELKPGYKLFNIKYCPVPRINKETFCRELKLLV